MKRPSAAWIVFAGGCLLADSGCQTGASGGLPNASFNEQAILVAAVGDQVAATPETTRAVGTAPTTRPATAPAGKPRYTAPGAAFQQMGVLVAAAVSTAAPGTVGIGKEAAEARASAMASRSFIGAAGVPALGAPQPVTLGAVVGQPGLQRGFAAGLGFAGTKTIFTLQKNPLSGPTGRINDLVRAGFFPNAAAGVARFKR